MMFNTFAHSGLASAAPAALYVVGILFAILVGRWTHTKLREHRTVVKNTPILLSESLGGETDIIASESGATPHGMHVEFYIARSVLFSDLQSRGLYMVELPFASAAHLIGIPTHNDTSVGVSHMNGLERIELEGTYNQVFHLYAEPDQQVESRHVLDPTAMVFTIDFCQKFNWEIIGDTLYFMDAGHLPSFAIVDEFIEQIRPAINTPSERTKNPHKMSYTHLRGRTFLCPVCNEKLAAGDAWLACPNGHGCLVTGKQLLALRQLGGAVPVKNGTNTSTTHGTLHCPYCKNLMKATRYQNTPIEIDVCSRCMFRWLDADEPTALFS